MKMTEKLKKLLCVEDNPDECELVKEVLSEFEVTCSDSLEEAKARLGSGSFDVVIIDEHLTDGSGMSLCKSIARTDASVPIILISGDPYVTAGEARDAGARVFLTKGTRSYIDDLRRFANILAKTATA